MVPANEKSSMVPGIQFDLRKLRYERLSRKCNAADMGRVLGISSNAYYKKERGETNITVNEFCVILTALEIPVSEVGAFFKQEP